MFSFENTRRIKSGTLYKGLKQNKVFGNHLMFDHIDRCIADGNSISMESTPIILKDCLSLIYVLFLVCEGMIKYTSIGCDEQYYRDLLFNKPGLNTYQLGREACASEGGTILAKMFSYTF